MSFPLSISVNVTFGEAACGFEDTDGCCPAEAVEAATTHITMSAKRKNTGLCLASGNRQKLEGDRLPFACQYKPATKLRFQ
jgi:hypothetical protein